MRHSNILIFSPETVNAVVYFIFYVSKCIFHNSFCSHQLLSGLSWRRRRTGCNSNSRWTPSKENLEIRTGSEVLKKRNKTVKKWTPLKVKVQLSLKGKKTQRENEYKNRNIVLHKIKDWKKNWIVRSIPYFHPNFIKTQQIHKWKKPES